MKKVLALFLALIMVAGFSTIAVADDADPVSISLFTSSMDIETWHITGIFEERFNFKIDFQYYPSETAREKFNIMVNTGDLPDFVYEPVGLAGGLPAFYQLCMEEVFLPIDDAIAKWGPNIAGRFEEFPDIKRDSTFPDGHMYAFMTVIINRASMMPAIRTHINSEWLKNVGMSVPTTAEEFYEVLKAFKEQDANGNGDPDDEIPFAFWDNDFAYLLSPVTTAFIHLSCDDILRILDEQGNVQFAPAEPGFRDALRFWRRLYVEDLLYHDSFVMDRPTLWAIAETNPDYSMFGVVTGGNHKFNVAPWESNRWMEYEHLFFLRDEAGDTHLSVFTGANSGFRYGINFNITDDKLEPLTRLFDYHATPEGAFESWVGVIGENVDPPEPGDLTVYGNPAMYRVLTPEQMEERQKSFDFNLGQFSNGNHWPMWFDVVNQAQATDPDGDPRDDWQWYQEGHSTMFYTPYALPADRYWPSRMVVSAENSEELNLMYVDLRAYVKQACVEFITGKRDIEVDWDAYLNDLGKLRMDRFVDLSQVEYDAIYK